ncbi:MAG: AmmeMemoRadiSam system radical SAM enzyme [Proteobacteria bacterium]|nr:AmmeMemoRadiSam system radical SAM enzyme [Pseudomonadota bacterium]
MTEVSSPRPPVDGSGSDRRHFLKACGAGLCAWAATSLAPTESQAAVRSGRGLIGRLESPYYQKLPGNEVRCTLCPNHCRVSEGQRGQCRVRENLGGRYYSRVFGNPCAVHVDPVEKKPFFHVLPGTRSLSVATAGCNFTCKFCQNWEISQNVPERTVNFHLPPAQVVRLARKYRCPSICSTYVEPTIFFEYMYHIGRLTRGPGLLNLCHSNGFINPGPLRDLAPYLDAACIDLKGFSPAFYQRIAGGELGPVLETLKLLRKLGKHLEIVNLVIPTLNDDRPTIGRMCRWIVETLGPDTPVHFSRFYPQYQLKNLPPTPVETLENICLAARRTGLRYVYLGNVPGHILESTYCPKCRRRIVHRVGYVIRDLKISGGKCAYCGLPIAGLWTRKKGV